MGQRKAILLSKKLISFLSRNQSVTKVDHIFLKKIDSELVKMNITSIFAPANAMNEV